MSGIQSVVYIAPGQTVLIKLLYSNMIEYVVKTLQKLLKPSKTIEISLNITVSGYPRCKRNGYIAGCLHSIV